MFKPDIRLKLLLLLHLFWPSALKHTHTHTYWQTYTNTEKERIGSDEFLNLFGLDDILEVSVNHNDVVYKMYEKAAFMFLKTQLHLWTTSLSGPFLFVGTE